MRNRIYSYRYRSRQYCTDGGPWSKRCRERQWKSRGKLQYYY